MTWSRIRPQARCAFGHTIWPGTWALFGRPPFVLCADHAGEKYGLVPPYGRRNVAAGFDVKARQTGEAE